MWVRVRFGCQQLSQTAFLQTIRNRSEFRNCLINMVKSVLVGVNKVRVRSFQIILWKATYENTLETSFNQSMEYLHVYSPCLDQEKHWYIFYSTLHLLKPSKFSKRAVFNNFPDEVRKVRASRRIPSPKQSTKKFPSGWGFVFCRFFLVTTLNEAYLK